MMRKGNHNGNEQGCIFAESVGAVMPIMSIAAASIAATIRCENITATKTQSASDNIAVGRSESWIKPGAGVI